MVRNFFIAGAAVVLVAAAASLSQAQNVPQMPMPLPGGGVVIPGPNPIVITPDRLNNPQANQAIPGTQGNFAQYIPGAGWVYGTTYVGQDGKPHGTTVTPNPATGGTTTTHYLVPPGGSAGSATPQGPASANVLRQSPANAQRPAPANLQRPAVKPTLPRIR
jgi:hypothetical protein